MAKRVANTLSIMEVLSRFATEEDAVRRLLFKKPGKSAVPDDYEPTEEELEEVYKVDSMPQFEQDD